ncbi:MAG: kynureninase [Candidatus Kapaibacteriota bacterium]
MQEYHISMDAQDSLCDQRNAFYFPQHEGNDVLYFCGNSLGLQPKGVLALLEQEVMDWRTYAVEGHFHAKNPWFSYHSIVTESLARIVGALPSEVVAMQTLTANLHLAMVSFYRPTKQRYKILMEAGAFPSDQYAIESQALFHGFDPDDAIIEIKPREGEHVIHHEDIIKTIEHNADSLAIVMFSGVQYLTGQRFQMKEIGEAAHNAGAICGLDLAHAIGNVELHLHDWNIDFAVWCTYKYLNSGPGGIGGLFIHDRHAKSHDLPRFAGWWGYDEETRFLMKKGFTPSYGASGWQLSNAQVFQIACLRASLDIFDKVDLHTLFAKRDALTAYAEEGLLKLKQELPQLPLEIITPKNKEERGAQLSLLFHEHGKVVIDKLIADGIIVDWREPNIIRMTPAPLYTRFSDVHAFIERFRVHCIELFGT